MSYLATTIGIVALLLATGSLFAQQWEPAMAGALVSALWFAVGRVTADRKGPPPDR